MVVLLTAYIHEANIPDLVRRWGAAAAITPYRFCICRLRTAYLKMLRLTAHEFRKKRN